MPGCVAGSQKPHPNHLHAASTISTSPLMTSQAPQPSASKAAFSSDCFEHTPLDTTSNSIRLLRILPDLSNTGLLQCEIWHATTDAEYTCLSYVWGAEANQETILINGKRLDCRKNLWDFLSVARIKHTSGVKAFWIDAVCIDQTRISERNHQVRQMGDIMPGQPMSLLGWDAIKELSSFLSF